MVKLKNDIEKHLRQAIHTSGLSRYRLAQMSGVSEAALSLFVNGHRSLTLSSVVKLAEVLDLELRPRKKGR